jgi:hypothetical protein
MMWLEFAISSIMGLVGSYLLYRGKKIEEPKLMLWGAVLIILSYYLFSLGGKDEDTKAALKAFMPQDTEQQMPQ